jgi:hypothetical protein
MARIATIVGWAIDNWGDSWDVREERPTKHGFNVLLGWPYGCRGKGFGGPRVIVTAELAAFFEARRLARGEFYDLPAGRTAIKRVRRLLGMNFYDDSAQWWIDHADDVFTMSGVEFSERYGIHESTVSKIRVQVFGRRFRDPFWWKEPAPRAILLSTQPCSMIADRLEISVGAVRRLRHCLNRSES